MSYQQNRVAIVVGVALVVLAAAATFIGWMTRDPATKSGQLRRSLDAVSSETERRDREIQELTQP
ncbi:hypothetical protein NA78x_004514 [Anatilimnocola sp. NA78]|uniref:hypothetical protein n=1 Tax=Anatilimnocola sp. NA78 TaxID=3415683 RepID=UPI003CE5056D